MFKVRRSHFSYYDGHSVPSLLQALHDSCESVPGEENRLYMQTELRKLQLEAAKPLPSQNREEIRATWRTVKPGLRTSGIWRGFDSPRVKGKLLSFIEGHSQINSQLN